MKKFYLSLLCFAGMMLAQAQDFSQVYIIGDVTPNSWDNGKALPMVKMDGTDATFQWTGHLNAGSFKFINTLGSFQPAFNATQEDVTLSVGENYDIVYNESTENDFKFIVPSAGAYTLTLDMKTAKISFDTPSTIDRSQVFIIGDATLNGWANDKAQAMKKVEGSEATFEWTGRLNAGSFKLINALNTFNPCFNATEADKTIEAGYSYSLSYNATTANDYLFKVTTDGTYQLTVNLNDLTLHVDAAGEQKSLWFIGDAVPDGTVQLSPDPKGTIYQYKYAGKLGTGTLKIADAEIAEDATTYYLPTETDTDILNAASMTSSSDATLAGWKVAEADDYYKIKVNTADNTISAIRMQPRSELYMIGGATEAGWTIEKALPFTQDATNPNLFTFEGELRIRTENNESNLFKILGQKDWGPYSLHPYSEQEPALTSQYFIESVGDAKWSIDAEHQGQYLITIDLLNETFSAEYLGASTGIDSIETSSDISITSNDGAIQIHADEEIANARLFSVSGHALDATTGGNTATLGGNLSAGIYIVAVQTTTTTITEKIAVK